MPTRCLEHYQELPCRQCAEDEDRGYQVKQLAGRCADGFEGGHGRLWHAINLDGALCGAKPGRRSAGWSTYTIYGQDVTCPKCLKKLRLK